MTNHEYSPFYPGSPIHPEFFVGRQEQIKQVLEYVDQAISGRQENVFLTGERGIGKSSFASFILSLAVSDKNMLGIHSHLGRVTNLEEMVRHVFDQILKETRKESWFGNIKGFFGNHIEKIGLFGVEVSFNPSKEQLGALVRNFPAALYNLMKEIKKQKSGLFIALDDINGLAEKPEFANWYKSTSDEIATHHFKDFPVFIMLIGLPEKRRLLSTAQPSLMRIFKPIKIEKLSDSDIKQFISKAFSSVEIEVEKVALDLMVRYSGGLPILMHEIGDAAFRVDEDSVISRDDASMGIYNAAKNIGNKYLDPQVYDAIRSKKYKAILRKLGEDIPPRVFEKSKIADTLSESEKKVLTNFLGKMTKLGVIKQDKEYGRGSYSFLNDLYRIYIWIESQEFAKKARKR